MAFLAQEKVRVHFFLHIPVQFTTINLCLLEEDIWAIRYKNTSNLSRKKTTMKTHNKTFICFYLIKCSATKVSIVNNYHSITWIILVNMAGFKKTLIFSCVFPTIYIRKPPLLGQAWKEKWRWKLFHYLRRQPITYITFSNIHSSTPNVSCDLVRTHS